MGPDNDLHLFDEELVAAANRPKPKLPDEDGTPMTPEEQLEEIGYGRSDRAVLKRNGEIIVTGKKPVYAKALIPRARLADPSLSLQEQGLTEALLDKMCRLPVYVFEYKKTALEFLDLGGNTMHYSDLLNEEMQGEKRGVLFIKLKKYHDLIEGLADFEKIKREKSYQEFLAFNKDHEIKL